MQKTKEREGGKKGRGVISKLSCGVGKQGPLEKSDTIVSDAVATCQWFITKHTARKSKQYLYHFKQIKQYVHLFWHHIVLAHHRDLNNHLSLGVHHKVDHIGSLTCHEGKLHFVQPLSSFNLLSFYICTSRNTGIIMVVESITHIQVKR